MWRNHDTPEQLAARLAPLRPEYRSGSPVGGDTRSYSYSGRAAAMSAFDRALENEMRGLADLDRPIAGPDRNSSVPANRRTTAQTRYRSYGETTDQIDPNFALRPNTADGNGSRILVFGAIAIAALMLSGVSALALFSGPEMQISGLFGASASSNGTPVISVARAPHAQEHTGTVTLKPILAPEGPPQPAIEPIVPRQVATTRITSSGSSQKSVTRIAPASPTVARSAMGSRGHPASQPPVGIAMDENAPTDAVALAKTVEVAIRSNTPGTGPMAQRPGHLPPEADPPPAEADLRILSPVGSEPLDEEARRQRRQLDALLERGRMIMESGDIASARLIYERVYEAGDPRGALAIAATYDPETLRAFNVIGLPADRERYIMWSRRAEELANRTGNQFVVDNR